MLGRRAGAEERVRRLNAWLRRRYVGRDWYGVAVEVEGARGRVRASLVGRGQALGTATGAAAVVRALAEEEVKQPGIWLAEEVVAPESFFGHLATRGLVPAIEVMLEG
jgi:saccharopine dehydrogenase-like NADP-dependent oxidoreductase